ncbi:hypothetical protein [Candidatus Odyssella thessalonicensis]|nr:hypothetical protein [Candidatus Odyssella thessalonicensis]
MTLGHDFIKGDGYEIAGAPQFPSGTFGGEEIEKWGSERSAYF